MNPRAKRYPEALKRKVVAEIKSGQPIGELRKKYSITGGNTVKGWLKKYGTNLASNDSTEPQRFPHPALRESSMVAKITVGKVSFELDIDQENNNINIEFFTK